MEGSRFKVPIASLGRRKKASAKIQVTYEPTRETNDEATTSVNMLSESSDDNVPDRTSASCRDGQSNDNRSLNRENVSENYAEKEMDEIQCQNTSPVSPSGVGSTIGEETPSDNKSKDDDEQSCAVTSQHDVKSPSGGGGEGSFPRLPYTVPHWSSDPPKDQAFSLSVIKHGVIIDEVDLTGKAYIIFGRLPNCDVQLEHPSISRYHAVLQYRPASKEKGEVESENHTSVFSTIPQEPGYYVYDLGSTHGTYLNKRRLDQRCYFRVRIGQMMKFGGSSRLFLLESSSVGVQYEVEADAKEEIKEITAQKEEYEKRLAAAKEQEERLTMERENTGVSWGIMMDDVPLEGGSGEEYEIDEEKEAFYKEDPKKALKKFFDREGLELEYEVEEEGPPKSRVYTVRVRLPIDTVSGEAVAEASVKGKKKDAVLLCALNACRMLDAHDILRQPAKAHKRKKRNWEENDYYDSDEDTFLDRTGTIEKKRKKRMKKAGVVKEEVESYDSLQTKLADTLKAIQTLEQKLRKDSQSDDASSSSVDSLDAYMISVGDHFDKTKRSEIKYHLHELRKDEERLRKLIEVVKPTSLPVATERSTGPQATTERVAKQATTDVQKVDPKVELVTSSEKPTASLRLDACESKITPEGLMISSESRMSENDVITREKHFSSSDETTDAHHAVGDLDGKLSQPEDHSNSDSLKTRGKKRKREIMIGPKLPLNDQQQNTSQTKVDSDPDYSDWLPPEYQTGDGKTHLNEKYGY